VSTPGGHQFRAIVRDYLFCPCGGTVRAGPAGHGVVSASEAGRLGGRPADVKRDIRSASILRDGRAVFNIAGNKYRIVVWINYPYRVVYIRFIGTHRQYDAVDAQSI
jgi:hypothetical protein